MGEKESRELVAAFEWFWTDPSPGKRGMLIACTKRYRDSTEGALPEALKALLDCIESKTDTPEGREWLLNQFSERDRQLIEEVIAAHPTLTVPEAIEALHCAGGL